MNFETCRCTLQVCILYNSFAVAEKSEEKKSRRWLRLLFGCVSRDVEAVERDEMYEKVETDESVDCERDDCDEWLVQWDKFFNDDDLLDTEGIG